MPGAPDRELTAFCLLLGGPQGAVAIARDPLIAAATRCRAGELDAAGLVREVAAIERRGC